MKKPILGLAVAAWLAAVAGGAAAQEARVVTFSPQGLTKTVRQVRASFSVPMVPFGDPRAASTAPFEFQCPEKGEGSWVDQKNWVYNFTRDLFGDVSCVFRLKPGLKALSGASVTGPSTFEFNTGGPLVTDVRLSRIPIPEDAVFALMLNAKPNPASIPDNVYFEVQGIQERIGARVVEGPEREQILAAINQQNSEDEEGGEQAPAAKPMVVLIQAQRPFPPRAKVKLVWGKGVAGVGGGHSPVDQVWNYNVRDEFQLSFSCERENAKAGCIPILPMQLNFSAGVPIGNAAKIRLKAPDGSERRPRFSDDEMKDPDNPVQQVQFTPPFPADTTFSLLLPSGLKDDAGRSPVNAGRFPLDVKTAEFAPLAKFAADFGIVERYPEAVLPVTLRNLEASLAEIQGLLEPPEGADGSADSGSLIGSLKGKVTGMIAKVTGGSAGGDRVMAINEWMERVINNQRDRSVFAASAPKLKQETLTLPKPNGPKAFEVVGIPLTKPGFYVVELKSQVLGKSLLGKDKPVYVPAAALVTNLSVHLKSSADTSLVWVTGLSDGRPVGAATVDVWDCTGKRLARGTTDAQGRVVITGLPRAATCDAKTPMYYRSHYFVTASKGDDFSFVHSSWNEGIQPWRFNLPMEESDDGHQLARTVFDRTLLRAGETVHMKHFMRLKTPTGFAGPSRSSLPAKVSILHEGSGDKFEVPVVWRETAVGQSDWSIPKDAKLGRYNVSWTIGNQVSLGGVKLSLGDSTTYHGGTFRVEEFRVPLLKAMIQPPAQPPIAAKSVPVDLFVTYLAGGAAGNLPVNVRYAQTQIPGLNFAEFDGFEFANGPVPIERAGGRAEAETTKLTRIPGMLNDQGTARIALDGLKPQEVPTRVAVELDFLDPNGEVQTAANGFTVYPAGRLVGLMLDSWLATRKGVSFKVGVADLAGKPVAKAAVEVVWIARKIYSHRVRLVGGFYGYQQHTEMQPLGPACAGPTNARGVLECSVVPPATGNLFLEARVRDEAGRASASNASLWVYQDADSWFGQDDSDRMDVLPAQKQYEPGQTAKLQVRLPFRQATALITVEREGVLDSFVRPISADNPVIELPIKPHYAPNVFVSVLAVRGRVSDVQPTALVDLGRPAYKLGIAEINVGWKAFQLNVRVLPEKPVYRVREQASVRVEVSHADGTPFADGEAAVAVVDEGLLELSPNTSWDLLKAMMARRADQVMTSTAQGRVIGKRHFGLKALPSGGGGGRTTTRELFDTLLFWDGAVKLGPAGQATASFPLNDSVTGFRVVAIAHSGAARFGTGSASIRSTQEVTLFSGVSPLVREGDQATVEFTVRNAGTAPLQTIIAGKVTPLGMALPERRIDLAPGAATPVRWPLTVPYDVKALTYEVSATAPGGNLQDRIKVTQLVAVAIPVQTLQSTFSQADPTVKLPVQIPADAVPGRGGVRVIVEPTILGAGDGVTQYMTVYPYRCLEQQVSVAVALQDQERWSATMRTLPVYLDGDGLAKFFPSDWLRGSPTLTAYVLSIAHAAGWKIPAGPRERMLNGLAAFVQGKVFRAGEMPAPDLVLRKLSGLEALARYDRVTPEMVSPIEPTPGLWPTSAVVDWYSVLQRVAKIPNRERLKSEAEQALRARLTFQGSFLKFSTESADGLFWLLTSADQNANRLILAALDERAWKEDLPRLMQGSVGRLRRGHWDTTLANAWGRLALMKFAAAFEPTKPAGTTAVSLAAKTENIEWASNASGKTLDLPWPAPNAPAELQVQHAGAGRPWVLLQSRAAVPLKEPLAAGYRIKKTVTPIERKRPDAWSRGDIVKVTLEVDAQTDMTWVVVNDPIPAGATLLGSGLGRGSALATVDTSRSSGPWYDYADLAYVERSFEAYRAYYSWVPKGALKVEYSLRLNQAGTLNLPPTRVEAMYAPENLGLLPNAAWTVVE